jgi:hypothetical protein
MVATAEGNGKASYDFHERTVAVIDERKDMNQLSLDRQQTNSA